MANSIQFTINSHFLTQKGKKGTLPIDQREEDLENRILGDLLRRHWNQVMVRSSFESIGSLNPDILHHAQLCICCNCFINSSLIKITGLEMD